MSLKLYFHPLSSFCQKALVALIDELDPKRKYTAGYDLKPIDLSDNAQPTG